MSQRKQWGSTVKSPRGRLFQSAETDFVVYDFTLLLCLVFGASIDKHTKDYCSHLTKWQKGRWATLSSNVTPAVFGQTLEVS